MERKYDPSLLAAEYMRKNTPIMRYNDGDNFAKWQSEAREKLYELLGLDMFVKCESEFEVEYEKEFDEFREIRFSFQSEEGYYIPCHLLIPNGAKEKTPVFVCLQGHSSGMHISLGRPKYEGDEKSISGGDRDFAIRAVKEGFCAVTVEQRYMGERGGNGAETGCASQGTALASLLIGRTAIGERVWDTMRAIDVLIEKFPIIDESNIMCMGNSGGGTTTYYVSCIDERIKLSMPSCSVCTYKDSIAAMHHCCCNYIPNIAKYFDMGDLGGLLAPRKLIVVAGKEDPIFPIEGVMESYEIIERMYKAAGAENNVKLVIGDGGHRFYANKAYAALKGDWE